MGAEISKVELTEEEEQACRRIGREKVLKAFAEHDSKHVTASKQVARQVVKYCSASVGTQTVANTQAPDTAQNAPRCATDNKRKAPDEANDERVKKVPKTSSEVAGKDHGPTNLVLTCCERAWNVHREVVLPASPALFVAYVQASDQSTLRMRDCKPAPVHAMLDFLYNGQYNAEKYCETGESYPLHFHALMYLLATTYEIGPLAYTAFTTFSSILVQDLDPPGLRLAIQEICQTSSDRKMPLRMVLLAFLQKPRPVKNGQTFDLRPHPLLDHARSLISTSSTKTNALSLNPKASYKSTAPVFTNKLREDSPAAAFDPASTAQNPLFTTTQSLGGLTKTWPEGNIEYVHCKRIFKKGYVKGMPGLFACPYCRERKSAIYWDSVRKPWNWSD